MTTISIEVDDELARKLQERAQAMNLTINELALLSLREAATSTAANAPQDDFERATAYVLSKNAELYRRLA